MGVRRPANPTIAELREITQPPVVRTRAGAEHWVASLYLRDLSPYLTRGLLRTGISANGVTGLMVLTTRAFTLSPMSRFQVSVLPSTSSALCSMIVPGAVTCQRKTA